MFQYNDRFMVANNGSNIQEHISREFHDNTGIFLPDALCLATSALFFTA